MNEPARVRPTAPPAHHRYASRVAELVTEISTTQIDVIEQVIERCADAIAADGLVYLFGSGHSRIAVEEMYPRYGSFPGFLPMVELSLTQYHQVVGANGLQQAMFIENAEGLGTVIVDNYHLDPTRDVMIVVSAGGTNAVPIEVAMEARSRGVFVVALTSLSHSAGAASRHSSGSRLFEVADVVIDTCTPVGDASIAIDGLDTPVGPLTTAAYALIVNMVKTGVAERLVADGHQPQVLTSAQVVGAERAQDTFRGSLAEFERLRERA